MSIDFDVAALEALFFLGHTPGRPDAPIIYPAEKDQRPHLAYYGTTRSGKTFAIEYALRQLAEDRSAGFCFIDPHASGYWRMASFLRQMDITERVLFWDINDPEYIVTYDPFGFPNQSPSYIAGNLTAAVLATLGQQDDPSKQALLKTMTETGLLALLKLKLPFLLANNLFDPEDQDFKRAVHKLVGAGMLGALAEVPKILDRYRELGAPYRRFENLFQDDRLKLTFITGGLDFKKLMDERWIVLVNTEPRDQSDEAATLFIRLLVKSLFMAAKQREASDDPAPFFLAIDEASRYLTTDTARILKETAKYGLYLLLGMQGLEQAKLENEESYLALRENVNGEIVMRLVDQDEKMFFTRRFLGDYLDLEKVKYEETHTTAVPRTVAHVTRAVSHSTVAGGSSGQSRPSSLHRTGGTTFEDSNYSTTDGETETPAFHVEYDYEPTTTKWFYTPDELEREAARDFSVRQEGQGQRFGMARVNERPPTKIEIPEIDAPMYSRNEMVAWLRTFKATQPATLPLVEAKQRFDSVIAKHVQLLTQDTSTISLEHEPPATRQPKQGAAVTLKPATGTKTTSPRKKREEEPS
ncbi:MAG: hypothetical protein ACHQ9S_19350 [Candidatus Binatia bacterium]